jgi:hypothetical protein
MCASSSGRAAAFLSASGWGLSQETAERKVKVQSALALNTIYITGHWNGQGLIVRRGGCWVGSDCRVVRGGRAQQFKYLNLTCKHMNCTALSLCDISLHLFPTDCSGRRLGVLSCGSGDVLNCIGGRPRPHNLNVFIFNYSYEIMSLPRGEGEDVYVGPSPREAVCTWTPVWSMSQHWRHFRSEKDTAVTERIRDASLSLAGWNIPWRPIGLWDVKDPTLSRQSAHS